MAHGAIERAFELARTGGCRTVRDIRDRLMREQFASVDAHLAGPAIRRQLAELMRTAPNTGPPGQVHRADPAAKGPA